MNSEQLLNVMDQLSSLAKRVSRTISENDLTLLENCLDLTEQRSYSFDTSKPEYVMASAVTQKLVQYSDSCPKQSLSRLVRLAVVTKSNPEPLVIRAITEQVYEQITEMLKTKDPNVVNPVVRILLDSSNQNLAETFLAAPDLSTYLNVEKGTLADFDFNRLSGNLVQSVGPQKVAKAFSFLLSPGEENAIRNIEFFTRIFGQTFPEDILKALADVMTPKWSRYSDSVGRYIKNDESDRVQKDYVKCRDIIKNLLHKTPYIEFIDGLDALCDIPFHQYRKLAEGALALSAACSVLTSGTKSIPQAILRIVGPARIHPAAFRFAMAQMRPNLQQALTALLTEVDPISTKLIVMTNSETAVRNVPVYDQDRSLSQAYDPQARIWPKNNAIVTKLFEPIEKARSSFANLMIKEWQHKEDYLSERLLSLTSSELQKFGRDRDLGRWLVDTYNEGVLRIQDPYVPDRPAEWGADIGIIVNFHLKGILSHTWGFLLQAKKAIDESTPPIRWEIDRRQVEGLILRTRAAYYLLYMSQAEEGIPYVIPAHAVLSCMDAIQKDQSWKSSSYSIPHQVARTIARSWSVFFLEDVIGAWSGEPNPELINSIREGVAAKRVFEFQIIIGAEK